MLRIGLCDDDPAELAALNRLVEEYCAGRRVECEFARFASGEELLLSIRKGALFDILFLDVFMGAADGVSVARKIRESDARCCIIFATNSRDHAIDGYGVHALHYLLKPVTADLVRAAMEAALVALSRREDRWVQVEKRQGCYHILLGDIIFAESNARVVTVHTRLYGDLDFYGRLDDFECRCGDDRFLRCHKSFLVNLDHVHAIVNDCVVLDTGKEIRISTGVAAAKALFASHTARNL